MRRVLLLAGAVSLLGLPVHAQEKGTVELGGFGRYTKYDGSFDIGNKSANSYGGGGRIGYFFSPKFSLELDGSFNATDLHNFYFTGQESSPVRYWPFHLRALYHAPLGNKWNFLVGGGPAFNYWGTSRRGDRTPREVADALRASGRWDLVFTDVGDRDAGFREARGEPGAWWTEKDFEALRAWGAELHERSGLPLVLWRVPLGNTVMAACNNTPWHYMDNRAEYWLEKYPENRRIAEWAAAGFVGLLFGGGTIECTVHKDNAKDGVTNPTPIPGNKGEASTFADDDGGYLRLRAGNYYKKGPQPLPGN